MKRCPKCQRTFSDDISFCLEDGTALGQPFDQHEQATVIRASPVAPQFASNASRSKFPVLACSVIALLLVLVFGAIAAWLVFEWNSSQPTNTANIASDSNQSNTSASPPQDQPPTRIDFARGSIQQMVSDNVYVRRSYLLRTSRGQYLLANITSANGCVVFDNNGEAIDYTTKAGDSIITIHNKCSDQPVEFRLVVFIH